MANKMSLGFVNDTHRGMRDSLVSARISSRAKPSPPPQMSSTTAPSTMDDPSPHGVVPVIESKKQPMQPPKQPPMQAQMQAQMQHEPAKDFREPRDSNTFERRLDFVVNQVRGIYDTVSTIQGSLRTLETSTTQGLEKLGGETSRASKLSASLLTIRGACIADAPQFKDASGSFGEEIAPVAQGTSLVLAYPMVREKSDVLMRRMNVNPHTAAISWTWVVLYRNDQFGETRFVGDFAC